MSDELRFINAFIGFCTPMGGTWPDPLQPLAYHVVGVEREILTSLYGQPRMVVPELIIASGLVNHVLCLEAKSATLSIEQAQKYVTITNQQLVITGILPPDIQPSTLSHDTLYVVLPKNSAKLHAEMQKQNLALPIVVGDTTRFALVAGKIGQAAIQYEFQGGITIEPYHQWPAHFVQFNSHASVAELAAPVVASLSRFLLSSDKFTTRSIAERAVPHWQYCGTQEQNAFLNKIHEILNQAQQQELNPYFKPTVTPKTIKPARNTPWQSLVKRPMSPNAIIALQRNSSSFVNRQQTGAPFKKQQPPLPGLS